MLVAYAVVEPTAIVKLPYKEVNRTLPEDQYLACPILMMAAVQFKPTEQREAEMTKRLIAES